VVEDGISSPVRRPVSHGDLPNSGCVRHGDSEVVVPDKDLSPHRKDQQHLSEALPWPRSDSVAAGLLSSSPNRPLHRFHRLAFALSVSAVVLLILFWTMLPLILGVAGALLGFVARDAAADAHRRSRLVSAAIALGAVSAVLTVAAYVATS
jgi:hypothetical protein